MFQLVWLCLYVLVWGMYLFLCFFATHQHLHVTLWTNLTLFLDDLEKQREDLPGISYTRYSAGRKTIGNEVFHIWVHFGIFKPNNARRKLDFHLVVCKFHCTRMRQNLVKNSFRFRWKIRWRPKKYWIVRTSFQLAFTCSKLTI